MNRQQARSLITQRLLSIFETFKRGEDVSPACLYRAEGVVEACCEFGLINVDQAFQLMAQAYQTVYGQPFSYPVTRTFSIPVLMKRAPVYPST